MSSATSVNRILANHTNLVRAAVITATAQRASTDIRLVSQTRQGRGRMTLSGPYSGAADSTVEVEILAGAGSAMRSTAPQIQGVGNGTLTITSLDSGAVAQTLTFTLADDGDPATCAELPFYGVTLRARTAGAAGNALALAVTRNLVYADLPYSLLDPLSAGTTEMDGAQWDFGAAPATGAGIPAAAPRIAFETFPQVHRHWKEWTDGRWVYHLDPAPTWNVPEDVRVQGVSGDYSLSLSDGVTTETYSAITLYDFLSAVQSRSALIEVVGVVVADTAPGGQAVTDIPLRTDAHALPVEAKVSGQYAKTYLDDVTVAPAAPTENVRIQCLGLGVGAQELWSVSGSVSGALGTATSGAAFGSAVCGFTIPQADVPPGAARIAGKFNPTSRTQDEGEPSVCFKPLKRGARATAKTLTFTYTKRPPSECDCNALADLTLSNRCLGLDSGGGGMALDPDYQSRLTALYDWRADFMRTQADTATPASAKWAQQDMDLCDLVVASLADALAQVYEDTAARTAWDTAFAETQGDFTPLDGVGVTSADVIAQGMAVGAVAVNPVNGCAYRLDVCDAILWSDGAEVERTAQATLIFAAGFSSPWSATPGDTVTVTDGQVPPANGSVTTYDAGFTCLGIAPDLRTSASPEQLARRYRARMDHVLSVAGIVPKSDASNLGDGCWRDLGGSHWWVESTGRYLPAFTNAPYIASELRDTDFGRAPFSTQEFGFGLVVDCAERLKTGDAFTITIEGASVLGYSEGDLFVLPIIGAQAAAFGGGEDGDATQTWAVSGSVGGTYPDWLWDPGAPAAYTAGPANATLAAGGIPFEQGDLISLAIEGGQLRWRRDGGAWTAGELYAASHDLGAGLTLAAVSGAAPSFLAGDVWTFKASATHGLAHLRQPREGMAFAWDGAAVTLTLDLGSVQPIEALLLALHSLPSTAVITLYAGDLAADEWTLTPAWRVGPILMTPVAGATARYLTLSITGAGTGAAIGWLWAGIPWAPTAGASSMQHIRQYGLSRTSGRNPSALYRGRGTGGKWGWSLGGESALMPSDVAGLWALLDHVAEQGLEWVCLVPDVRDPTSATLAQIEADSATLTENLGYQHDGAALYDVELPFRAVLG